MGKMKILSAAVVGLCLFAGLVTAHEGHDHKVMGTVAAVDAKHIEVADKDGKMKELAAAYPDGRVDWLDGVTVQYDDWWFNVRPSNTEPLLRLNVEARTAEMLEVKTDEVLALIRAEGGGA